MYNLLKAFISGKKDVRKHIPFFKRNINKN